MSRINVANFRHPDGTSDNINITSGGDVGIGTASPNNNYGTNLAVHDSGTTGARLKLSTSGTGEGNTDGFDVISTGSNAFVLNRESGTLALGSNNTTAAEIASGGEFRFNSGYGSVATAYGVRAWARVTGLASATMDADGGFTSFTDNGTGDFSFAFNNTFTDANYAVVCSSSRNAGSASDALSWASVHNLTTSGFDMRISQTNTAFTSTVTPSDLGEVIGVAVVR